MSEPPLPFIHAQEMAQLFSEMHAACPVEKFYDLGRLCAQTWPGFAWAVTFDFTSPAQGKAHRAILTIKEKS